jgi:hypothetical protein
MTASTLFSASAISFMALTVLQQVIVSPETTYFRIIVFLYLSECTVYFHSSYYSFLINLKNSSSKTEAQGNQRLKVQCHEIYDYRFFYIKIIALLPVPLINPILHTAWLNNQALTLKRYTAKYYFGEKSSFLHTFRTICFKSRKI